MGGIQPFEDSAKHDEEYSDDDDDAAAKLLNREAVDQDALLESITRFDSAVVQLEREVEKWKGIGKDDEPLIIDDSIVDAMVMELESTITSVVDPTETKTEIDDLLKEKIQADVEIIAITTTTKGLITGPLHDIKLNLQQNSMQAAQKLETKYDVNNKMLKKLNDTEEEEESVKKLQNRVCRLTSCLVTQLILLFVTFYLNNSCQNVGLAPT